MKTNMILNQVLASTGIDSVFDNWRGSVMGLILSFVQRFLSPVIVAVCIVIIIVLLVKIAAARKTEGQGQVERLVAGIVVCFVVAVLAGSFAIWGAQFFQ